MEKQQKAEDVKLVTGPAALWRKFQSRSENTNWEKDEYLDLLYWGKQLWAVIAGLLWGILALKGIFALVGFILTALALPIVYTRILSSVDPEEMGGIAGVIQDGFVTQFAMFLVFWIVSYSFVHF
ncbi:hypothetical protein PAPYR_9236 [Paratrimastix pyriformis]|uniref:Rab5-interacting protein n=1 Tax=Paratrimastix pyriformis TaxID=342808 RepID=A0ABQ8U8U9_9EUKA|nr:hypothetical protein PAPYR_9236 [Paratrimastix pyriformis]